MEVPTAGKVADAVFRELIDSEASVVDVPVSDSEKPEVDVAPGGVAVVRESEDSDDVDS
jgi:hypothetical protein